MSKGDDTRRSILSDALELSSELGLEGVTIGMLARKAGMSKSGLYAHFQSKEQLQCQVLDAAAERFVDVVLAPAFKAPRGIERIEVLFARWLVWEQTAFPGGCLFISAATEFDDRQGPVRDHLVGHVGDVLGAIARSARIAAEVGQFRTDVDDEQFAFDFWGVLLSYNHFSRLLGRADAEARAKRSLAALIDRARP